MLRLRWAAVVIFVLSAVLNYLDRQVLATMVDIWRTRPDFPFSYADYGRLLTVFSIAYALAAPLMGMFLDRVGLNRGISFSVLLWAIASVGTGMSRGMSDLLVWRALLGVAEAAGVSAFGKCGGMYLPPAERALGSAASQLGLSVGAGLAPRFAVFFAYQYSWRWAFYGAAAVSLIWIPIWLITARLIPPAVETRGAEGGVDSTGLIRDRRLWALVAANAVAMTIYSLWTNWSPTYLVRAQHLSPAAAANYSWAIPLCGYIGAFLGGSLSFRFIRNGDAPVQARKRVCFLAAACCLATALVPLTPSPLLATMAMSFSFLSISAFSTNLYTVPVDLYGGARAGFGVAALLLAYGAMQAVISRPLGAIIETHGFQPVCFSFAVLPMLGYLIVRRWVTAPTLTIES